MKKHLITINSILILILFSGSAYSFDGHRKGFILGGGLGLGICSYTQTAEYLGSKETSDRENTGAITTDFKIGFAPNEQTEIFYTSKVLWFGMENAFGNNVTISSGVGSIGIKHSVKPLVPTYFLSGGIGWSSWSLPFENNAPDAWLGPGFYVGTGYEFSKHYSVEFDILFGKPGDSEGGFEIRSNTTSFKLTLNATAY